MKEQNKEYISAAHRLGNYLKTKGLRLQYSHQLEAVAAVYGAKDYNTLVARRSCLQEKAPILPKVANLTLHQWKLLVDAVTENYLEVLSGNSELLEEYIRKGLPGVSKYSDSELVADAVNNLPLSVLDKLGIDYKLFQASTKPTTPNTIECEYVSRWASSGEIVTKGLLNLVTGEVESLETVDMQDDDDVLEGEFARVFGRDFELEESDNNAMAVDAADLATVVRLSDKVTSGDDRTDKLLPYSLQFKALEEDWVSRDVPDNNQAVIVLNFNCMAEDAEHAIEQVLNAYPYAEVVPDSVDVDFDTLDVDEDDVAEWVGLHYGLNFERMAIETQNEWKLRFWQSSHMPD